MFRVGLCLFSKRFSGAGGGRVVLAYFVKFLYRRVRKIGFFLNFEHFFKNQRTSC